MAKSSVLGALAPGGREEEHKPQRIRPTALRQLPPGPARSLLSWALSPHLRLPPSPTVGAVLRSGEPPCTPFYRSLSVGYRSRRPALTCPRPGCGPAAGTGRGGRDRRLARQQGRRRGKAAQDLGGAGGERNDMSARQPRLWGRAAARGTERGRP